MRVKEEQLKKTEVIIAVRCDICKKESKIEDTDSWFYFGQRHEGWGSDSWESSEHFDVCSVPCYLSKLKESVADLEDYIDDNAVIADMPIKFVKQLIVALEK